MNTVVLNNKPSQTNNTINNNKESEKQSSPNNINNILYNRERVIQRNTYYISNNKKYNSIRARFRIRRDHIINFRVNDEELDIIIGIAEKTGANNLSQVIREAIMIYHALLSGVKEIDTGKVIVQNPVVNLNIVNTENNVKAESRVDVSIDVDSVLSELSEIKKLISNWHRMKLIPKAAYDTSIQRLKKIEKLIKQVN